MNGAAPIGLPPATMRIQQPVQATQADVSQYTSPIDTVIFGGAVTPPSTFDEIQLNLSSRNPFANIPPSLASMLDKIKQRLEEALRNAREEAPDFFERLEIIKEKLGLENEEALNSAAELVAAVEPDQREAFINALEQLGDTTDAERPSSEASDQDGILVSVSDLNLRLDLNSQQGPSVRLEGMRLNLERKPADSSVPPKLEASVKLQGERISVEKQTSNSDNPA